MSYPNSNQRQNPSGGGHGSGRGRSHVNTPYTPLSQPQTNDYVNYPTTNLDNQFGAYPAVDTEPWPYAAPEYGWANGASVALSGGHATAEYPLYPLPDTVNNYGQPPLYPTPYAHTNTNEPGFNVWSGNHNVAPSPPPATLNPQVLHQSPPTQSTGSQNRKRRSPQASQVASSSVVDPNPPSYRIVLIDGRESLQCLCGCGRSYGRHNEWARAHEHTETVCRICGSVQSRLDSLRRHMRVQHGVQFDNERSRNI